MGAGHGGHLIEERLRSDEKYLQQFKSMQIGITLPLLLALVSEIELFFRFGLSQRIRYLWTLVGEYSLATKEVYRKRYESLLPE
jgi:hypothetical protein